MLNRLESAAPDNGILMSYETYAHAKDLVEVEELESITMKGVKREIKVYSILNTLELEHQHKEDNAQRKSTKFINVNEDYIVLSLELEAFSIFRKNKLRN